MPTSRGASRRLPDGFLPALRARLEALYGARLVRAVLFGSYARGEATAESDVDVLVVLTEMKSAYEEAWALADVDLDLMDEFGLVTSLSDHRHNRGETKLARDDQCPGGRNPHRPMTDESRALLGLSAQNLAGARRDMAAEDSQLAAARAYYAAFHAAGAALAAEGRAARSHAGTRAPFSELFVQTGRVSREMGRDLSLLMDLRQRADYHAGGVITMGEGADAVQRAEAFVAAVEALLSDG